MNSKQKILIIIPIVAIASIVIFYVFRTPNNEPAPVMTSTDSKLVNIATFICTEDKFITAKFFEGSVDLSLSDGRNLLLPQTISGSGARYANTDESFVFWNKGDGAFIEENNQTTFNDCLIEGAPKTNLTKDLYPLYQSLVWGEEASASEDIFGLKLSGFKVDSEIVTDGDFNSFRQYYDNKLLASGWVTNPNYMADGAGSSVWAYTKGDEVIILSYNSTAINQIPDQPLSCPCNVTFSIFSGK